ncbi:protein ATP6V1FNB-like [Stegostoma tigrinum]|uniref:protein ATP6V1FNB-like n=1 Tax=Stegostoma tigrinum TaxID=3053191 RepID=UPI002870868B|nr:protein ATP6V1FNB-like [Stegostoma tigrinum]
MDDEKQNFWKEGITKEDLLRLCWLRHHQQGLNKVPRRGTELKKVLVRPHTDLSEQKSTEQEKEASVTKGETEKRKAEEKVATDSFSDMRPVTPEVRALLYDGCSKEEKGRYQYLKARTKKGPSEKYNHAITSSWEYGWRLGERMSARHS